MSDRRPVILFALIGLMTLGFLFGVLRPTMASVSDKRAELASAVAEEQLERDHLAALQSLDGAALQAQATRLDEWFPDEVRLSTFVRQVNLVATRAGINLTQIAPSMPGDATGVAARAIGITLVAEGRYARVLDFHRRLEGLSRAVKVGGLAMNTSTAETGAVSLQATIVMTMFADGAMPTAVVDDPAATATAGGAA